MVKCPSCSEVSQFNSKDTENWLNLFKSNGFMHRLSKMLSDNKDFCFYFCKNCELIFIHPMKNPGSEFYEEDFLPYHIGRMLDSHLIRWPQKAFLKNRLPSAKTLLDIGCNTGLFLNSARDLGYDVTGIDFDKKAINIAKNHYKLDKVFPLTLQDYVLNHKDKFDVVTLFDVLEHLDNVSETFMLIEKILNKNKYIVLSIPNRERNVDTLTNMDLPPHHLTQWNEKSITHLLNSFGYKIIKIDKSIKPEDMALFLSLKTSIGLVRNKVKSAQTKPLKKSDVLLIKLGSKYKSKLVSLLGSILYLPLSITKKQSSTMYVLAQLVK
ncbi:MAG: class I SAM-dependent methyltransferase [Endomicrobiales bacterium]|nr:class I SAM-dependent methyltransferase [Endomicrobiales bacterium]